MICDVIGVVGDEIAGQPVDGRGGHGAAVQFEPAFDQLARARADHAACRRHGHERQPFALEHIVQCADEIRGRG